MSERLPRPEDWSAAAQAGTEASSAAPSGGAPTQRVVGAVLPAALLQQIVDAARGDAPNETVGLLVATSPAHAGGQPTRYLQLVNAAASPYRYLIDPQQQLEIVLQLEDAGEVIWAIVHSHVASPPVPSATDIGLAFYPDSLYVICSLAGEVPDVRAWSINGGEVTEVPLAVS